MMTFKSFKLALALFALFAFSSIPPGSIAGKYKLILFEGSDWCVNCIRLEKNVLSNATFIKFLEQEDIEIERIDFPQKKQLDEAKKDYNAKIAEKYNFKGVFPTIILVKSDTNDVVPLEYHDQSYATLIAQIRSNLTQ